MSNRAVFTLATIVMVLFFLASHLDFYFFALHFLEAVIYLVILLLLFYGTDDWAYAIGFFTPLVWMALNLLGGGLLGGLQALGQLVTFQPIESHLRLVNGFVLLAGLALSYASGRAFWREVWGTPGARRTLLGAALIVGAYYAAIVFILLRMVQPNR
ncbi:MAG: hypothetical protein ACRD35_02385 [Candidatus Acidiferrales bacterium]